MKTVSCNKCHRTVPVEQTREMAFPKKARCCDEAHEQECLDILQGELVAIANRNLARRRR